MAIDIRNLSYGQVTAQEGDTSSAGADGATGQASPNVTNLNPTAGANALQGTTSDPYADGASRVSSKSGGTPANAYISSVPDLPDPVGPQAPLQKAVSVVLNTTAFDTSANRTISAAEAFNLIQRAAQQGYDLATTFNRLANKTNINAKQAEAVHLQEQVAGEREHANTALAGAVVGAGLGSYIGIKGSGLMRSDAGSAAPPSNPVSNPTHSVANTSPVAGARDPVPAAVQTGRATPTPNATTQENANLNSGVPTPPVRSTARNDARHAAPSSSSSSSTQTASAPAEAGIQGRDYGSGMSQMGQPVSNVVTTAFDTYDKTSANGGQYQADQARIAQKTDQVNSAIAQTTVDTSKASLDQAQETLKAGQEAVKAFAERQAQVMNNIANR